MVTLEQQTERYLKWRYVDEIGQRTGYIVLEKYDTHPTSGYRWLTVAGAPATVTPVPDEKQASHLHRAKAVPDEKQASHLHWNIELIRATPERQGVGTILLNVARAHLPEQPLSFCPTSPESAAFFAKQGAKNCVLPPLKRAQNF